MRITSKSEDETLEIAYKVGQKVKDGGVILLYGDLGTGKTIFSKGIAKSLNIDDFKIKSPTYTYIRKYRLKPGNNFYHLDLYRLEQIDELMELELNEILENPHNIIVIEWAEKLSGLEINKAIEIKMKYLNQNHREITIKE